MRRRTWIRYSHSFFFSPHALFTSSLWCNISSLPAAQKGKPSYIKKRAMERFRSIKQPNNCFGRRLAKLLIFSVVLASSLGFLSIGSIGRTLSISYGDGQCLWQPPNYNIPETIDWFKTLVVGFPSGDKRLAYMQLESLTGWSARDEWAYEAFGMKNHPFIKSNYPHYDGAWGWEDAADQTILVVRNVRRTLTEFHHIMWDLEYATTYADALKLEDKLFENMPPKEHFLAWRDDRVMNEIHWYGWFIDYWMEGGMMRDVHTHKLTIPDHWFMFYSPDHFHKKNRSYNAVVGNGIVESPSYDQRCKTLVSGGCTPVAVVSAERLLNPSTGPAEAEKMGNSIQGKHGISDYLIDKEAWGCIWQELIINKKGAKTFLDREGIDAQEYNFSEEMLNQMIYEVDRMILKYSTSEWQLRQIAQDLVGMLQDHKASLEQERMEVKTGIRVLTEHDFLGPETRRKMELSRLFQNSNGVESDEIRELNAPKNYSEFFQRLEEKMNEKRITQKKQDLLDEERRRTRRL